MTRGTRIAIKTQVWILCLLPLGALLYWADMADLTANPISFITNWLGDWTLRILLVGLALTPLRILTGVAWPLVLRRLIGLFAFAYATLHFSVWLVLDHFFNWPEMGADILKRRYITVGMLALTLLIPLAVTSTNQMVKRLGGKAWRRLHRLVYVTAMLAVIHFLWLEKVGRHTAFYYAGILLVLLGVRAVDTVRRSLRKKGAVSPLAVPSRRRA